MRPNQQEQRIIIKFLVAEVLKFIVDYLQYLRVILCNVQECLNGALAFAAVVNLSVMMFVLGRRVRQ